MSSHSLASSVQNLDQFYIYSNRALSLLKEAYDTQSSIAATDSRNTPFHNVTAGVRGRAYFSDSEEEEDEDEDEDEISVSHESEEVTKGMGGDGGIDAEKLSEMGSIGESSVKTCTKNQAKRGKNNKTKDELLKLMNSPPLVAVTIGVDGGGEEEGTNIATAIELPSVLIPKHTQNPLHDLYTLSKQLSSSSSDNNLILVLTLQSGRFAAAIFDKSKCKIHTTSTRYTTRKGQGGAQSSNDNAKGKANSIGSQLRRAGENQLRQDVADALLNWKDKIGRCAIYFLKISNQLLKGFWDDVALLNKKCTSGEFKLLYKKSEAVRSIPLDVGKPSYEGCCAIHESLLTCTLQKIHLQSVKEPENYEEGEEKTMLDSIREKGDRGDAQEQDCKPDKAQFSEPLTPLHLASRDGHIEELTYLLSSNNLDATIDDIDARAGVDNMTSLHYAASARDSALGSKCVFYLLVHGHANPCMLDSRNRLPYFLSSHEQIRNAFRKARSELGEESWDWERAKVGPPLSEQDMAEKKKKAADKKKRQRQRQKERKAKEKIEQAEAEQNTKNEAALKQKEADAKRVRDGLKPKKKCKANEGICDFCGKDGLRKTQMFHRLDYRYCSTECVKKHQRELTAAAAVAR
eukprot:CAMPEP_0194106132 /NCGR_PEP_ID=MMETSP0150-20130528/6217_1 /TAXON_ID=122233 /ORGANISM="Chaetoceros debilis, Strain MM31A-1" /LENGTH=630 /DNA_ID=CAMNT_0038794203 /DNA_START=127 /DNA_END=2016 /DNA_ORIENTATION=-